MATAKKKELCIDEGDAKRIVCLTDELFTSLAEQIEGFKKRGLDMSNPEKKLKGVRRKIATLRKSLGE
jgi:hypothetical protein